MNNVKKVTDAGMCVGCGACDNCEHINFESNALGFPAPVIGEGCVNCGECLKNCIYWDEED